MSEKSLGVVGQVFIGRNRERVIAELKLDGAVRLMRLLHKLGLHESTEGVIEYINQKGPNRYFISTDRWKRVLYGR